MFNAHQPSYESLKNMILADGLDAVTSHGEEFARQPFIFDTPEAIGLSAQRAKAYRDLMVASDVKRIDIADDGEVLISMASWGMANRGWRISAAWRQTPPEEILPSLDAFRKTSKDWQTGYSAAGGNWYFRIIW